jgi:hypothetical protein
MTPSDLSVVPLDETAIRGAAELERTEHGLIPHRLPAWARSEASDGQLAMVEAQPSGVRLAFRTSARVLELDVHRTRVMYGGLPPRPDGVVDLVIDGRVMAQAVTSGGVSITVDLATGARSIETGAAGTARFGDLPEGEKNVELWLPHNETVELLELRSDAPVSPEAKTEARPTWLHHGSSISQGSNAARPTGIWPAVAARSAGAELINLGFGGSALMDPFVARVMRDTPADVISLKLGINLVNSDVMRMRAFGPAVHGFLDTIRDGHPSTPVFVVSPIFCAIHEDTPGPGAFDPAALARGEVRFVATGDPAERAAGKLTLTTIRAELARIVAERRVSDPHLHYLDGLHLYGEQDAVTRPLPDALHPDPATHVLIGERFARYAFADTLGIPLDQPDV